MNIFLPQSNQAQIELEEIVDVQKQIITPATSTPIMGMVQDGLLSSYNLTQPTMKIDWKSAMNIISYTTFDDFSSFKKDDIQGTDLFSLILPAKINMSGELEIKNGKMTKGYLSSKSLGLGKPHNLIHTVWNQYGPLKTRVFLNDMQRLFNNFNLWNGFSVGIGDIYIPGDVEKQIHTLIETKKLEIDHLITEMENNGGLITAEIFENTIKAELDTTRSTAGKIIIDNLNKNNPNNSFAIMSDQKSGSRGNVDSLAQMIGLLGQQSVEGKRIQNKYNGRSLAYCPQNDDSALGRGFIEQPFCKGVHPTSFIFHNMGSRESLIDTAIKSVTGDTEIIIIENNNIKQLMIGDWIDNLLNKFNSNVKHYTERDMELLELNHPVYIPTTDENGNVSWDIISAITRHDPGIELYEIKTSSGRHVIVTESKSLLIWNEKNKCFERTSTPDVKIGDFVPVTYKLSIPDIKINDTDNILSLIGKSDEKICDLLGEYVVKYGTFSYDSIFIRPKNKNEISSLGMLLSRLGIFSKLTDKNVSVYGINAKKLSEMALSFGGAKFSNSTNGIDYQNDVILDKIISIKKIDVSLYPKVYDLTIPSTLNFGLANGLHVVDTAESGYVQRKLIKAGEDISVKYDSTVRNSNNTIIQFTYGDNGIDTTKQAYYNLNMLEMSNSTIATKLKFTDQELKNVSFNESDNNKFYKSVLKLRNQLRIAKIKTSIDNITFENGFMLPVNIKNIISSVKNNNKIKDETDLEPQYVLDGIKSILEYKNTSVTSMNKEESNNPKCLRYRDEILSKSAFKFSLYENLSPKICIFEHKIGKNKFDKILEKIINAFTDSVVQPGEMVGIVAAQSIGEPTTQMSAIKNTMIVVFDRTKKASYIKIGNFIDKLILENKTKIIENGKDIVVMNMDNSDLEYYIVGVSDTEKTSWNRILQISRHPANGNLVKVTTRSGKSTTATLSHSFLKRTTNSITAIKGSELKVGDRIPVAKHIPVIHNPLTQVVIGDKTIQLNKEFGWFCGIYISDGSIGGGTINITKIADIVNANVCKIAKLFDKEVKQRRYWHSINGSVKQYESVTNMFSYVPLAKFLTSNFGDNSYTKKIASFVFASNKEFISGVISGLFDGDGNVNSKRQQIRYGSRSEDLIKGVCILLSYCDLFASKLQETSINFPGKVMHTLCVQRRHAQKFKNNIGLQMKDKADALDEIIEYHNRDNKKTDQEAIDMIPELGTTISQIGKLLELPGQSRLYKRFEKKEAIGRSTLKKFIKVFKEANDEIDDKYPMKHTVTNLIKILEQAADSDIVWDKIVKLEYLDDPKDFVYDFTVPGNDSFMVDEGILVHNTLSTFHSAGIKSSTSLGVPRVKELLSLSRNLKTPELSIYLTKENRNNQEIANKIGSHLKHTVVMDVRKKIDIYYDPNPLDKGSFMDKDGVSNIFYSHNPSKNSCQSDVASLPWLLRIELDREKMMEKDVTLLDIKAKYCNNWEKRYIDVKGQKKEERTLLEKIIQTAILSNSDNDVQPLIHIRFDMSEFDFSTLVSFIDIFVDNFKLKGVEYIDKINGIIDEPVISFDNEDEELKKGKQFVIYTGGVNLQDIRYLNGIDLNKTVCNDIISIYETYGIDAARNALIKEFKIVFAGAGSKVNFAHIELLCDLITNSGVPISIDRHGMNKSETDPLARASFEKTVEQLITAAVFSEVDNMNNVSSRIMAGLVIKGGTGLCEVILDSELLEKSEYTEDIEQTYVKTYNEVSTSSIMSDIISKDESSGFFVPE